MVTIRPLRSRDEFLKKFWGKGALPDTLWAGEGAKIFDLKGKVDATHLSNLFQGLTPGGKVAVVLNPGSSDRLLGLEITFRAPTSESVLWAMASDKAAREIESCHKGSVEYSLHHVERAFNWDGGNLPVAHKKTTLPIFAVVHENVSPGSNPDLHSHVAVLNFDGRLDHLWDGTKARIEHHVAFVYDKHHRAELGKQGLLTVAEPGGYKIIGVPDEICRHFMKNVESFSALKSELFECWKAEGASLGWGSSEAALLLGHRAERKSFLEKISLGSYSGEDDREHPHEEEKCSHGF